VYLIQAQDSSSSMWRGIKLNAFIAPTATDLKILKRKVIVLLECLWSRFCEADYSLNFEHIESFIQIWRSKWNILGYQCTVATGCYWGIVFIPMHYAETAHNLHIVVSEILLVMLFISQCCGNSRFSWQWRFEIEVFWVVTPRSDVGYRRFGGPCCLHLQVTPYNVTVGYHCFWRPCC